jgi:ATP-binding cassette subfamily C protein
MLEKSPSIVADGRILLALAAIPAAGICVVRGYADIFARIKERDGAALGRRRHVARIQQAGAIFGGRFAVGDDDDLELIAVAGIDAEYGEPDPNDAEARVLLFEDWATAVTARVLAVTPAEAAMPLAPGPIGPLGAATLAGRQARPQWICLTAGACSLGGIRIDAAPGRPRLIYLPAQGTLDFAEGAAGEVMDTATALGRFDTGLLSAELLNLARGLAATELSASGEALVRRRADRDALDERELSQAFTLLSVIGGRAPVAATAAEADPLIAACRMVMNRVGIALPETVSLAAGTREPIARIARAARARMRRVVLPAGLHRRDNGPLLCFDIDDGRPLALLPRNAKRYAVVDPKDGTERNVDAESAAAIAPFGYCFYRPFPATAIAVKTLLLFATRDIGRDWVTVLLVSAATGLLGLVTPIFSQMIFDSVIPNGDRDFLVQLIAGLFAASIGAALFGATQNIALLRMETRMQSSIDLALWDRLLSQPSTFYRRFTVGDLAQRAGAVNQIRRLLSTAALSGVLGSLFSVFNFGLLFHYSAILSVTALGLIAVDLLLAVASTFVSIYFMKRMQERSGRLLSVMNQLLSGIAKLRTAAAEIRAFRRWADVFSDLRHTIWQSDMVSAGFETFNSFSTVATTIVIFAMVGIVIGRGDKGFSIGDFIGFNVAFGALSSAVLGLGTTLLQLANVMPLYDRARPILESLPETAETRIDPGLLMGSVSASGLCFRYEADGPLILNDVSMAVRPGEFVALVGPSGSGKSTLLRLLLGLETPESGSVFYDGQDLASLDLREVRQQIGVVMQTSRVLPGSILENIVGASGLSQDEAWQAARMAGLDEDIAQMPMRMSTLIMEGGGGLSGGQQQRLQIARAIARKPRLLFLDEATSALDNRTQAIVTDFLKTLHATRIVVAHRLSTIRDADRILVMKGGVIVEEGRFEELVARNGIFAELAGRQLG